MIVNVNNLSEQTIRLESQTETAVVIDQRRLPFELVKVSVNDWRDMRAAIADMVVRGAPLIGVSAAAAVALATKEGCDDKFLVEAAENIKAARPTAVNLAWAVERMMRVLLDTPERERKCAAWAEAQEILDEDLRMSRGIAEAFCGMIEERYRESGRTVHIMTHCNAGWLATVDWGTATAGIYEAFNRGIPVKVYASETRPRLQGTLTAWELRRHGVDVTLITDNAAGILLQSGAVDMVIAGADRIAANGDTANKVGTYLKALAARDNGVPFYIAAPYSTFDWSMASGREIPIEERSADEVRRIAGTDDSGSVSQVLITDADQPVFNPGFDVTPNRLICGFVTEQGYFPTESLAQLREKQHGK